MIELNKTSNEPIYMQIVQQIKQQVLYAKMHAHEQLPSVRKLARQLSINPNTVQKAYALLEKEGIIYAVAGKGDFVSGDTMVIKKKKHEHIVKLFHTATQEARDSGMWIDEIFQLVDEAYSS